MSLRSFIANLTPPPVRQMVRDMRSRRIRRRQEREYQGRSVEQIFSQIWTENRWKSSDSRSGPGSELGNTSGIREALPRLVRDLGVKVLLDAPCGDFYWMQHVDLGECRYIGLDVVQGLIEQLQRDHARADREFLHGDIIEGPLPRADLVLCRDCLFHLSNEQIHRALEQFRATGARWLLTTTYPAVERNLSGITGGYRDINLSRPPFSLGPPKELIDEGEMVGALTVGARRAVGLWAMNDVPRQPSDRK